MRIAEPLSSLLRFLGTNTSSRARPGIHRQALELYDGNYLDAYWAARAAHKAGQKNAMKLLLEKALTINPQYRPAKQYQEAYGK